MWPKERRGGVSAGVGRYQRAFTIAIAIAIAMFTIKIIIKIIIFKMIINTSEAWCLV